MDNKINNLCNQDDTYDNEVRQQETDNDDVHNDDDNVVGDWDPDDDLVVGGGVVGNNNQEIAANIRKETDVKIWYDRLSDG